LHKVLQEKEFIDTGALEQQLAEEVGVIQSGDEKAHMA